MNQNLIIVDDETTILTTLSYYFKSKGYSVHTAEAAGPGIELAGEVQPEVVLIDYRLPDMTGTEAITRLRERSPDTVVVLMTAYGTIGGAVDAVRAGALDYLTKPVDMDKLDMTVERALELHRLKTENRFLKKASRLGKDTDIIGGSPQIHRLTLMINLLAENSDTTVLIEGESGTGKEVVARAIHRKSKRGESPFVEVNCASLSEALLESELFGHERGAFTDAKETKRGLLEIAEGGTLFLDEIGELSPRLQPKLLRMLETRSFRRVGGTRDIGFDVRFIAATNRDLAESVRRRAFREDLYYRLKVMPLDVPPLRERGKDVLLLARHFVSAMRPGGRSGPALGPECEKRLLAYDWPGNVRELRNVIERALMLSRGDSIDPEHLPAGPARPSQEPSGNPGSSSLAEAEKSHILSVLTHAGGNQSEAARILGISRSTLIAKLKKYGGL